MAAQSFACPCLNIHARGTYSSSSSTDDGKIALQLEKDSGLNAEHSFLAHASYSSADSKNEAVLRCTNCQTDVAFYEPADDPHTLPLDGRIRLNAACLVCRIPCLDERKALTCDQSGDAIEQARQHESHSHAFRVLLEPPNAPAPHLAPSPDVAQPIVGVGSGRAPSPPTLLKPRHAQDDPSATLNNRLSSSVRTQRQEIDRQVSDLRRKSESYARRAAQEADILAARAGIQRGGFPTASFTTRSASGSSVAATAELASVTTPATAEAASPSPAVNMTANAAERAKQEEHLKKKFQPSPYPSTVVRPPLPDKTGSAGPSRTQSTDSVNEKKERRVTFVDPQPSAAAEHAESVSASDEQTSASEDGDDMFELDEDLPEATQSDESDTDGADAPETPRLSSPGEMPPKSPLSPSAIDVDKAAQARQLRDLLAMDLPSHRRSGRRRSQAEEEEESALSSADTESTSDEPSMSQYASSVPVNIDGPHSRGTGSGIDASSEQARPSGQRVVNGQTPAFATSLRAATEQALSHSSPKPVASPVRLAAEPMSFSKSPNNGHDFVGSFRGPSSLTAAFMRSPPPAQPVQHLPAMVEEAKSGPAEAKVDDEDAFVPPHVLSRLSRGDEALLSTSVRDLRD